MAYITGLLVVIIIYSRSFIQSFAINNGFSVKFNPIAMKEELKLKQFGTLFAKISQDLNSEAKLRREVISKSYHPNSPELGTGCTNQVAKLVVPVKGSRSDDHNQGSDSKSFINLPIVKQPYDNYKILVATAPHNLRMSGEEGNNPLLIYVVFSDDTSEEVNKQNLPIIYFVKKHNGKMEVSKEEKAEPLFIIDSNRTVTGLKSKEIEKFIKFKSKLTGRYQYQISR